MAGLTAQRTGFNFCQHARRLCADLVAGLPELAHVDLSRVAVCFAQARTAALHGVQATLTPLCFADGAATTQKRGRDWAIQRVVDAAGQPMLYVLRFYLPRFLDQPPQEKLITAVHELWHISPAFDGDLRRHPGRCYAHSHSRSGYDADMQRLIERWQRERGGLADHPWLIGDCETISAQHGSIFGLRIPAPKLHPVDKPLPPIRLPATAI